MARTEFITTVRALCEEYTGPFKKDVRARLQTGNVLGAYYTLTLRTMEIAVHTKPWLFVESTAVFGSAGRGGPLPDNFGAITSRTGCVVRALRKNYPWWKSISVPDEQTTAEMVLDYACNDKDLVDALAGNKAPPDWLSALTPAGVGTRLHSDYGEQITCLAAKVMRPNDTLQACIPGRLVHPNILSIGITPDGIAVENMDAFVAGINDVVESKLSPPHESAIQLTMELKTLHAPGATVTEEEVRMIAVMTKEEALALFTRKLVNGSWLQDPDKPLGKAARTNWKPARIGSFFKRTLNMVDRPVFDDVVANVTRVSSKLLPNFAGFPQKTAGARETPVKGSEWEVDVAKLAMPGKAFMAAYDSTGRTKLWTWEAAPLVLTYGCHHFTQVLTQKCTAAQYGNPDCLPVFTVGLKVDCARPRMALVYGYDVGITAYGVRAFEKNVSTELICALKGMGGDDYARELGAGL